MQTSFAVVAVGLSLLGCVYGVFGLLAARRPWGLPALRRAGLGPSAVLALAAVLALFGATRPTGGLFSPGQTLGWGVAMGGLAALLALLLAAGEPAEETDPALTAGVLSLACLPPGLALLLFASYPNDALMGCALGAALVATLVTGVGAGPDGDGARRGVMLHALGSGLVATGARLGLDHFPRAYPGAATGGYWAAPLLLLSVGALFPALLPRRARVGAASLFPAVVGGAGAVTAALVLQLRLLPDLDWVVPLMGLAGFALLVSLLRGTAEPEGGGLQRALSSALWASLLALALVSLGFRELHGYGQAILLIPGLLLLAPRLLGAVPGAAERLALAPLCFGLLLTLQRLYLEHVGRGRPLDFQQHYDVMALLGGALLVVLAGALGAEGRSGGGAAALLRSAALAVLAAAPLLVGLLWGVRTAGAMVVGLALGALLWLLVVAVSREPEREKLLSVQPYAPASLAALAAVQATLLVTSLTLSRSQKLWVVVAAAALAVVGSGLLAVARRGERSGGTP